MLDILKRGDVKVRKSNFDKNTHYHEFSNRLRIYFVKSPNDDEKLYKIQSNIWCENKSEIFFVFEDKKIYLCDAKSKPILSSKFEDVKIKSFYYGKNLKEEEEILKTLRKINSGGIWEEIQSYIKKRKNIRRPIDEDLLDNLIKLKEELTLELKEDEARRIIDSCLFIRFIEDKAGLTNLVATLEKEKIKELKQIFVSYKTKLNGDVFEQDESNLGISKATISKLKRIFGKEYIYSNGQKMLSAYRFDKIPVLLLSNIYEKFLSPNIKSQQGVVYTPENLATFIVEFITNDPIIFKKMKEEKIKVLDPSCGSGIFLVKFLDKYINVLESEGRKLPPSKIASLIKKSIFGIDLDENALRIASLSLYLRIFENLNKSQIQKILSDSSSNRFMFPGLKKENLLNKDSLLETLDGDFDLILGNPPWGVKFSIDDQKKLLKKFPVVSDYQSSQYFMLKANDFIKSSGKICFIINNSVFSNENAKRFRKFFSKKYFLETIINLNFMKEITFGTSSEPASIIVFKKSPLKETNIITPRLSPFSKMTKQIPITSFKKIDYDIIKKNYNEWGLLFGGFYGTPIFESLTPIRNIEKTFNDFVKNKIVGIMKCLKKKHGDIEQYREKYFSEKPIKNWIQIVEGLKGVKSYKLPKGNYMDPNTPLDRSREESRDLFKGEKLILTRSVPIRSIFDNRNILYDSNYIIFKLKENYKEYYPFFNYLFSTKLALAYLILFSSKRTYGNFPKFNQSDFLEFPIPPLSNQDIKLIEKINVTKNYENFIYSLYCLNYRDKVIIDDFIKTFKNGDRQIELEDLKKYAREFKDSFEGIVKEGHNLNFEFKIGTFGVLAEINIDKEEKEIIIHKNYEYNNLMNAIIRKDRIRDLPYEKNHYFYIKDKLVIYKPNRFFDWTRSKALEDVDKELEAIYSKK